MSLPKTAWHCHRIHEGSQGLLVAEFALLRVTPTHDHLPGMRQWLICRRSLGPQAKEKFYISNAPSRCPIQELVRISGLRWPIEPALEEAKGEVGLDHFETRTWQGWHHHMLQSFLANLFLMRLRLLFQKKARPSPPLKPINWWRRLSKTNSTTCQTSPPSCEITNVAIMPLTVHTANPPVLS